MAIITIGDLVKKLAAILSDIAKTELARSEDFVAFLRKHGYEKLVDDFEVLYVHTLVARRRAGVQSAVLDIFRVQKVVEAFQQTWHAGELLPFEGKIRWAIEALAPGDVVKKQDVDMLDEGRKFYDTFTALVSQTRSPLQQEDSRLLKDIHKATVKKMSPENEKNILDEYLEDMVVATSRIDIQGIYSMSGSGRKLIYFPIEQHYTPLKTMRRQVSDGRAYRNGLDEKSATERTPLTDLLSSHRRLLIVGEPGGGKTTFLRFIACVLAKDAIGREDPGRELYLGIPIVKPALIPILIRLSALAGILKKDRPEGGSTGAWRLLAETMKELFGEEKAAILQKLLNDGRCALLLDGLDEEPNPNVRKRMVEVTDAVLHRWGQNLIVLSSRPFGFHAVSELEQMATAHIDAFEKDEILEFLNRWASALFPDEEERTRKAYLPELKAAVLNVPRIRKMAKNPVMLTCLCVVHWNEKKLPEGKADLLDAVLRWLLNAKEEKRQVRGYSNTFAEECFKALALAMTKHLNGKQVSADLAWAAERLKVPFLDEMDIEGPRLRRKGMDFLESEMLDSGIVEQAGTGELRFWHLTFQEHYAAKALVEMNDGGDLDGWWHVIEPYLDDRQWDEVLEHFAGCVARTGRRRLNLLVERILGTAKMGDLTSLASAVGVLGRILRILEVYDYQPPARLGWEIAREKIMDIFIPEGAARVPAVQRIAAAEALGQASDPRFTSLVSEMLPVSGMADVLLGKNLLTVTEYQRFVESDGYHDRDAWGEWWTIREEEGWTEPVVWDEQREYSNRPVTGVSWYEATAYCSWLTRQTGLHLRLPKEEEWTSAATNPKGEYPWGADEPTQELLNFDEHVGRPTPAGIYPAGVAPGGHLDMGGNVWEWNLDRYDPKHADRVFRGGGWRGGARYCRSAVRRILPPGLRSPPSRLSPGQVCYPWPLIPWTLGRSRSGMEGAPAAKGAAGGREATGMTRRVSPRTE